MTWTRRSQSHASVRGKRCHTFILMVLGRLPPHERPTFCCASRLTVNVTRAAMREMGWCPSGRLFEAAACGVPVISDWWEGLHEFFEPGSEILIASSTDEVVTALHSSDA